MPKPLSLYLACGVVASVLLAFGLLMMKSRGPALPSAQKSNFIWAVLRWIRDPIWLGGLGVQAAGYGLYLIALIGAPVSMLAVMMQGGIAIFVIFAALFLGERASSREWIGIVGIGAAIALLALSLRGGSAIEKVDAGAIGFISGAAAILSIIPYCSRRMRTHGLAAAIGSGITFGLGSLYPKAIAEGFAVPLRASTAALLFATPWLYLTIIANLAGLILLQNSFHVARGIIVMPLSSACSNLVPILGGLIAFGEALPADRMAATMRVAAFALTILSSIALAIADERSSTASQSPIAAPPLRGS